MTEWRSRDGHWLIRPIVLNGQPMLRVETDYPVMPLTRSGLRTGPSQLRPGWWLQGDVTHVSQIEQWIPLDQLEGDIMTTTTTHTEKELRRLPKQQLARLHCEHGGVLTVAEYTRWHKDELVAAVLEDEQGHGGAEAGQNVSLDTTEWRAEVTTTDGDVWSTNSLRWDNQVDALAYAGNLARRWMLVTRWRAVNDTVPQGQAYVDGSEDGAW